MNSTSVSGILKWLAGWLFVLATVPLFAAETPVPRPPGLERDVQFWIRVYTEVTTNGGFLHDDRNLAVVYEKIDFGANSSQRDRQKLVDDKRTGMSPRSSALPPRTWAAVGGRSTHQGYVGRGSHSRAHAPRGRQHPLPARAGGSFP